MHQFSYEKRINPKWMGNTHVITLFGKSFHFKFERKFGFTYWTEHYYFNISSRSARLYHRKKDEVVFDKKWSEV